jgi:hypothetical protein
MGPVHANHYLLAVKTTKIAQSLLKTILRAWQPRELKLETP